MSKRINIMLPGRNLRELLKQEALANAQRDLAIAQKWFALEQEACQPKRRKRG